MDLISQVTLMGGVTDRAHLVRLRGAHEVDGALRTGTLVRDARGRYALPAARQGVRTASSVAGVLSHRSAAQYWGWAQKKSDGLPEVTVPRNRRVDRGLRETLIPHWSDLPPEDVVKGCVTSPQRTLVDCMRNLPWDEALVIADSALRAGDITKSELVELAAGTRGRGRTRIMAVAEAATAKSANIFESTLRAFAELVPGLDVDAQVSVQVDEDLTLHPDLADRGQNLVLEAEGFEWQVGSTHQGLSALQRLRPARTAGDPRQLGAGDVRPGVRPGTPGQGRRADPVVPPTCECGVRDGRAPLTYREQHSHVRTARPPPRPYGIRKTNLRMT
jgi:hypothetical protein